MIQYKDSVLNNRILWGTGLDAAKFLYHCSEISYRIEYVVEENPAVEAFHGYAVYKAEKNRWDGKYIIIASKKYTEIRDILEENGMQEFQDFIYYEWLYKKIVWLHGNCHMNILKEFLISSYEFREKYSIYPALLIQEYPKNNRHISDAIIDNCDVWIHQDIQASNNFGYEFCDEYLRRRITKKNPDILEIVFPNLFSLGRCYFPQNDITLIGNKAYIFENESIDNANDTNGVFPHTDFIINQYIYEESFDINKIIDKCLHADIIDESKIMAYSSNCIEKIKDREKNWDIKVSDYIEKNYKKKKLFYDPGHPTNDLMEYMAKCILKIMHIDDKDICCNNSMDTHELPIYPFVASALELEWKEKMIRKKGKKLCGKMDIEEYIREYIWWRMDCDRKKMCDVLQRLFNGGVRKIALFPYGSNARYVESIIKSCFCASITIQRYDNYAYDGKAILPYDEMEKCDKETIILMTAADPFLEKELYDQLRKTIDAQRIVHIMRAARG